MKPYRPSTHGDREADYDRLDWVIGYDEVEAAEFLIGLAKGGSAIELGAGTGRVAIPLACRGTRVVGIEASRVMAEQLERKPDSDKVEVVLGDFADVPVEGTFELAYCVQNTFFLLVTQAKQVRCFRSVVARLAPGGAFVLQTYVPDPRQVGERQHTETLQVGPEQAVLFASRHDLASQRVHRQQIVITEAGTKLYPMVFRYVWPSELDLMARLAGMSLVERWDGWCREPYTATGSYVSVYRKDEPAR